MADQIDPSESFAVSLGLHEDFIVARASGDLDYHHAPLFHKQVKEAWEAAEPAALILDLAGITFCDSMGVGVLVLLLNQSHEQEGPLVLTGVPPHLDRILTITGLRTAFLVEATVDDAIEAARRGPVPGRRPQSEDTASA
ncbi:STAS domain-containing protein [Microbispora sp. ATCC PTA-5024]|uniref:STAS domain-containing protein n=1 Tax=Microbispora sp. ATCC PTA-5024 TaxID=316330 RepID=UPI0003DC8BD3|nr:STAS domain-containing protein [Microbispora sp. ATCC PTA-5024]ETK30489.1 hypothetical protein MPTA5024_39925 [Microbispora sp. ATCC PTA-5024]